jgi:carbon-monoxide dehydrogenase small subunit
MLVTARDIVLRLPGADAERIRLELAGNLCRCTGYAGIVRAIQRVLRENAQPDPHPDIAPLAGPSPNPGDGGTGGYHAVPIAGSGLGRETDPGRNERPDSGREAAPNRTPADQSITETIHLAVPIDTVWTALQDPALIAQCVPGARLTSAAPDHLTGELSAALGPIHTHFTGTARVTYHADHTGALDGEGRDLASNTHLRASATFALIATSADTSDLALTVTYALRGPLAQLGRGPIVRAFAAELAETVARTLEARLRGTASDSTVPPAPARLRLLPLLLRALRRWLARQFLRGR